MQSVFSWAPKLARKCESKHWYACGADGRSVGHVITKFSGMGRFIYPWCSAGALRARSSAIRLNIDRDLVKQLVSGQLPNKSRHLDELTHEPAIWSWDTGQWLSCFDSCQLTILWMSYIKEVELPRHARDTPPFLVIVSPTPPVQSVDAYVCTYVTPRSNVWACAENCVGIATFDLEKLHTCGYVLLRARTGKFSLYL